MEPNRFKIIFVAIIGISLALMAIIVYCNRKKGVNVEDIKFQLKIGLSFLGVIVLSFWFTNISVISKLLITAVSFGIGLLYFLLADFIGMQVRKAFGIETEGDYERSAQKKGCPRKKTNNLPKRD